MTFLELLGFRPFEPHFHTNFSLFWTLENRKSRKSIALAIASNNVDSIDNNEHQIQHGFRSTVQKKSGMALLERAWML